MSNPFKKPKSDPNLAKQLAEQKAKEAKRKKEEAMRLEEEKRARALGLRGNRALTTFGDVPVQKDSLGN